MEPCQSCGQQTPEDELHPHEGGVLCDDCYMDALSPAKSCDPWATYTATRLPNQQLNPRQQAIMDLLGSEQAVTLQRLQDATGLARPELEREIAALRHMEMVRGAPDGKGGKVLKLFSDRS